MSVLERVGEIGLRRALGASRRHIAAQFLAWVSLAVPPLGGVIGLASGTYLALRAAVLEPVEALRAHT